MVALLRVNYLEITGQGSYAKMFHSPVGFCSWTRPAGRGAAEGLEQVCGFVCKRDTTAVIRCAHLSDTRFVAETPEPATLQSSLKDSMCQRQGEAASQRGSFRKLRGVGLGFRGTRRVLLLSQRPSPMTLAACRCVPLRAHESHRLRWALSR